MYIHNTPLHKEKATGDIDIAETKTNNQQANKSSTKLDHKTSYILTITNKNSVVGCNNLTTQSILTNTTIAHTVPQEQTLNVTPKTLQIARNTNKTYPIFVIKLHNKKAIYRPIDINCQTVSTLLEIYTKTHHKLPSSCRLSFANKTVCTDTPLSHYSHYSIPVFDIILPILGGMTSTHGDDIETPSNIPNPNNPTTSSQTQQEKIYNKRTHEN